MAGIGVFVLGGPRSIFDLFAYLPFGGGFRFDSLRYVIPHCRNQPRRAKIRPE